MAQSERETPNSWWSALKNWLSSSRRDDIVAVCIPPGAQLRVSRLSKYTQQEFSLDAVEEVTFLELSADAYQYRDAIRFRNGRILLLQLLDEGVRLEVLSLGSTEPEMTEREPEAMWEPLPLRMTELGK